MVYFSTNEVSNRAQRAMLVSFCWALCSKDASCQ